MEEWQLEVRVEVGCRFRWKSGSWRCGWRWGVGSGGGVEVQVEVWQMEVGVMVDMEVEHLVGSTKL